MFALQVTLAMIILVTAALTLHTENPPVVAAPTLHWRAAFFLVIAAYQVTGAI